MSGTAVLPCGCRIAAGRAIDVARQLLPPALRSVVQNVPADRPFCPVRAWAASGGMDLTGHEDAAPLVPDAPVLPHAAAALSMIKSISGSTLSAADDAAFLFGRASIMGLGRRGRVAAAGTCRLLRAVDGWVAVNLARPEDLASVGAIVERDDGGDPIGTLQRVARTRKARDLAARCQMLGVPAAPLDTAAAATPAPPAVQFERAGAASGEVAGRAPIVVDLSSLWAGPLCAHLLGLVGARVVKVESAQRPDAARGGPPAFFDWLHPGHESVVLDFATDEGRELLRRLVTRADVVIEASRPRALRQLGIDAGTVVASSPGRTWVSITGYGRTGDAATNVAFGDDAAVAGGLVARDAEGDPVFCGDAIADPLTGLFAAMAVCASVASGGGRLIDVAMRGVAAHVVSSVAVEPGSFEVSGDTERGWVVDHAGTTTVVQRARRPVVSGRAEALGESTNSILATLAGP